MAFWSGPAIQAFAKFTEVIAKLDPDGRIDLLGTVSKLVFAQLDEFAMLSATPPDRQGRHRHGSQSSVR
jgi:hypothetical protein